MDLVGEARGELLCLGSQILQKPSVDNQQPESKVRAALTRKDSEKLTWAVNGCKLAELSQEVGKTTSLLIGCQGASPISVTAGV